MQTMTVQPENNDPKAISGSGQAGMSAAAEWIAATSADGGYSVLFPAACEGFSETEGDETRHVLECFYGDYKKFLVRKYVFADARRARKKYLKIRENYGFFAESLSDATWQSLRPSPPACPIPGNMARYLPCA